MCKSLLKENENSDQKHLLTESQDFGLSLSGNNIARQNFKKPMKKWHPVTNMNFFKHPGLLIQMHWSTATVGGLKNNE